MSYFSRRFFIPFSVCFSIDSIKFDFYKGEGGISTDSLCFSEDRGMEFGIEKCAMLVMEKGKIVKSVGI